MLLVGTDEGDKSLRAFQDQISILNTCRQRKNEDLMRNREV